MQFAMYFWEVTDHTAPLPDRPWGSFERPARPIHQNLQSTQSANQQETSRTRVWIKKVTGDKHMHIRDYFICLCRFHFASYIASIIKTDSSMCNVCNTCGSGREKTAPFGSSIDLWYLQSLITNHGQTVFNLKKGLVREIMNHCDAAFSYQCS